MKKWMILISIILWIPGMGLCEGATGNINFAVSSLRTDDVFSKIFDVDERMGIGIICDVKKKNWPVSIAFEYLLSYAGSRIPENSYGLVENTKVDFYCSEAYLGIKKIFNYFGSVRPFVGGGIHTISMYVDIPHDNEFNAGVGCWVGGGSYFMLSKHVQIAFEWKWSKAKLSIFDIKSDVGGNHFDFMIGYNF